MLNRTPDPRRSSFSFHGPSARLAALALALAFAVLPGLAAMRASADDGLMEPQPFVVLHQTGGFAGIDDTTTIWTDGRIEKSRAKPAGEVTMMQLGGGAADVAALQASIEATGILDLPASEKEAAQSGSRLNNSGPPAVANSGPTGIVPCCDRISTTLTLMFTTPPRGYTTFDGDNPPPALTSTLTLVNDAIAAAQVVAVDSDDAGDGVEAIPDDVR
jgi:hypothetical protein